MNTEMENGTQMTFEQLMPEIFQRQTVGASASPVKISQSQENKLDFTATVRACFSELCDCLPTQKKKISPLTFSSKMFGICFLLMEDGTSPDFSLNWTRGGYDAQWQVLNSKYFVVPQNRERCFIIGHLRGRSGTEVLPVEGTNGADSVHGIRQVGGGETGE